MSYYLNTVKRKIVLFSGVTVINVWSQALISTGVQMITTTATIGTVPNWNIDAQLVVAHYTKPRQQQSDHFVRTKATDAL